MTENIKKLLELASSNEELKDRISKADKDEIISIAKDNGITLTDADFEQTGEISDDELDSVAGGKNCYCCFGGGGTGSEGEKTCACVLAGWGYLSNGVARCTCPGGGTGYDRPVSEWL